MGSWEEGVELYGRRMFDTGQGMTLGNGHVHFLQKRGDGCGSGQQRAQDALGCSTRAVPPIRTDIIKMILNVTISWFYLIGNRPSLGA